MYSARIPTQYFVKGIYDVIDRPFFFLTNFFLRMLLPKYFLSKVLSEEIHCKCENCVQIVQKGRATNVFSLNYYGMS